jgi:flagellar basal-body rod modification protein FlgD
METGLVSSSAATTTTTSSTSAPSQELDKNAFLMLLVAQLKNQDPTNAQDPNQMVQQTSYSQLEQMQNTNTLLQGIQTQNQGIFQAQASALVGKKVTVTTPNFNLQSGSASVGVNLSAQAASVSLTIQDASGNTVATLGEGSQTSGSHIFQWNGKDSQGNTLPDGTYTVNVTAKDASGAAVTASTSSNVTVNSVTFASDGSILLMAGGQSFNLSQVSGISQ